MRLRLLLAFLLLFLLQRFLFFRLFLLQLLSLVLMLLLNLLFSCRRRLLLRRFRVLLFLLLLDFLPVLALFRAELILLLLLLPVQLRVRGRLNCGPRRSRILIRIDGLRSGGPIGLRRLRRIVRAYRTFRWTVSRAVSRTIGRLYRVWRHRRISLLISVIGRYGPVGATIR